MRNRDVDRVQRLTKQTLSGKIEWERDTHGRLLAGTPLVSASIDRDAETDEIRLRVAEKGSSRFDVDLRQDFGIAEGFEEENELNMALSLLAQAAALSAKPPPDALDILLSDE